MASLALNPESGDSKGVFLHLHNVKQTPGAVASGLVVWQVIITHLKMIWTYEQAS